MKFLNVKLLIVFMIICAVAYAQTANSKWSNGKIFVRFNENAIQKFDEKGQFDLKKFDFITQIYQNFQITDIKFPFATTKSEKLKRTLKIEFSDYENIDELIKQLLQHSEIEYAEKIPSFKLFNNPPNDPLYNQTYSNVHMSISFMGVINIEHDLAPANSSWHLQKINAEQAWELQTGDPNIVVADIDNGIWAEHPDLENVIVHKYNAVDGTENTTPDEATYEWSHGTHTAGLIAAETDNGIGVASIGNGISLMAIKAGQELEGGFEAITYAVDNGAKIISMSWGSNETDQTLEDAINYAWEQGAVLLASAGNNGTGMYEIMGMPENCIMYPAYYENCIAVGATDIGDNKSDFSEYGDWINVLAPGGTANDGYLLDFGGFMPSQEIGGFSILSSTYVDAGAFDGILMGETGGAAGYGVAGKYDIMPGTSMSCPIAAGLCGLIWSANPNLTNLQVRQILESTCNNVDAQNAEFLGQIGHGRINAYAAVLAAQNTIDIQSENASIAAVFPNPANDFINVMNCENYNYKVYDILGNIVKAGNILSEYEQINISDLKAGSYMISIENQHKNQKIKVVKL